MVKLTQLLIFAVVVSLLTGCSEDVGQAGKKPAVPSYDASNGTLDEYSDLENAVVSESDIEELSSALSASFMATESRSRSSTKADILDTVYGFVSGMSIMDGSGEADDDNAWVTGSYTITVHNYSDDGNLFIGGELAEAARMADDQLDMSAKGVLNFAGKFKGSIKYDCTYKFEDIESNEGTVKGSITLTSGDNTFELLSDEFSEYTFFTP
jgi:hypothetical protein